MLRTHEAGTLRADHAGQTVTLTGWVARRRDHGGVAFLDLRDASGVAQVVARDEVLAEGGAHDVRNEFCVKVTGEVRERPAGNANAELPTGDIEVIVSELVVLNPAAPLPFQIDERVTVGEEARLQATATSTSVAPVPAQQAPRSACAPRSTPPPAPCSAPATSSRSRPRR